MILLFLVVIFFLYQIADALYEIMLPRFSGDMLPKTVAGTVLAIANRYDNNWFLFSVSLRWMYIYYLVIIHSVSYFS